MRTAAGGGVLAVILFGLLQRIIPIVFVELGFEATGSTRAASGLTWLGRRWSCSWSRPRRTRPGTATGAARANGPQERAAGPAAEASGLLVAILAVLAILPLLLGTVISEVLGQVMIFVLLGLGLNIVVGYAGLLDLGYVAFFAFGAYTTGVLTGAFLNTTTGAATPALSADLNFFVAVWIVALLAAGVGLLIGAPVLRLRGDYLAIVTLGLGEIVSVITASKWAQPLIGGPQGMRGVTKAEVFGLNFQDNPQHFYYLALALRVARGVRLVAIVDVPDRPGVERDARGRTGRRRDGDQYDEFKLLAFALGGAIGSLGGALFAVSIGSLTPASFEIIVSITALAVVILGGLGSIPGVVVGALVLIGLPGLLREFEEYRLLIYGGALVAIMILRPQGLSRTSGAAGSSQDEEVTQDAWATDAGAGRGRGGRAAGGGSAWSGRIWMSAPSTCSSSRTSRKHFGGLTRCRDSPSTSTRARSSRSSAPTAPARARCSTSSPACTRPTTATSGSAATTSSGWRRTR